MALRDLTVRTSKVHLAQLADEDEQDRLGRYARAWEAYDGDGPVPYDGDNECDNVRLDYPKLIVDKGVSFLCGKGGVEWQIDGPEDEENDDLELDPLTGRAQPPEEQTPPQPPTGGQPPMPEDPGPTPIPTGDPVKDAQAMAEHQQQREDAQAAERQAREQAQREREKREREARAALDEAWPEEQRAIDFHQLAVNGGVTGHAWLRLHETGRVQILDPANVTAEWDPDDIGIIRRYVIQWDTVEEDPATGLMEGVVRRKRIEPDDPQEPTGWTIFTEEHDDDSKDWVLLETTPWDHEYPPILGNQNLPAPNTFYGNADLECAVLDLWEDLQSIISDMRRILRLHGHPTPVFFGVSADRMAELSMAIGDLLAIPDDQGRMETMQVAELTSLMELYREAKTALFEAAHVPKVALGDTTNAGPTAGVALQVEYAPLTERTETKRLTYGQTLRQAAEYILDLKGYPDWRVTLAWPDLTPSDEATEATASEADLRMGIVSKQTIAEKRGYDWKVEQQRLADEKAEAGPDVNERLLGQLLNPEAPPPFMAAPKEAG